MTLDKNLMSNIKKLMCKYHNASQDLWLVIEKHKLTSDHLFTAAEKLKDLEAGR